MKPGAFTQLFTQLVFAPKYRERLLTREIRPELFSYISGTISNRGHKSIIVNGVEDHIHILLGLNPKESISDLVAALKRSSSIFINEKNWFKGRFHWQEGYGAFSYGKSQVERVYKYIENQENHHQNRTFREEYVKMLNAFDIKHDPKFLFSFFD